MFEIDNSSAKILESFVFFILFLLFFLNNLTKFSDWRTESFFSIIYWLISIHVIASIYHRFKQDGVWNSMVPFLKENKTQIK